jgi:tetratricopeptide (TPR) repeat protein
MFLQPWRLQFRKAEQALAVGLLEDAARILCNAELRTFQPAGKLRGDLAARLIHRARCHAECGNRAAAWADLDQAVELADATGELIEVRGNLASAELAEAESLLDAGHALAALRLVVQLRSRGIETERLSKLQIAAEHLDRANRLAVLGRVNLARSQWRRAVRLRPELALLEPKDDRRSVRRMDTPPNHTAAPQPSPGSRFCLWIDGVGGVLVCLGDRIVLGQPVAGGPADVPIVADLSRRHAEIRREGEGYLLVPYREAKVAGRLVDAATPLADGSQIELGGGVRLCFRVPHPLSSTARLEMVSRHRFGLGVDAVLLMASTCVLGPSAGSHVPCPWDHEVVLFRNGTDLYCRSAAPLEVDGRAQSQRSPLNWNARVAGTDFAFGLEEVA